MNINESVIVITGAAQGLGLDMATELSSQQATLALIDLDQDKLDAAKEQCLKAGAKAVNTYLCNVAHEQSVETVFAQIPNELGGLNVLVNNAGILRDGLLIKNTKEGMKKLSLNAWQSVMDVNLTGVFLCGREFALNVIEHKQQGCIINISSISRAGNMGQSNYSAAKAGVASLAVVWAKELSQYNIRTNAIAPGFIKTDMTASIKPEILNKLTSNIPAKRMGTGAEIAQSILFLIQNDYMNGRIIELDGGLRL